MGAAVALTKGVAAPPAFLAANPPELRGTRLRLIVERMVSGHRPEKGSTWLFLSPTGDAAEKDYEAWVTLPFGQATALAEAAAAFNAIMDAHEASA